jgi:hypothetical protein
MVNGYFDVLENQRFAAVELFFLLVLFKLLTVISMCLNMSGLWWWVVVLFLCFKNDL